MFFVCVIIIIIESKVVCNCGWFLFGHGMGLIRE